MPPRLIDSQCCMRLRQCIPHIKFSGFSTSSASHAQIPPESPKFIEVPRLVQARQPFPIQIKGILPRPRKIFPRAKKGRIPKSSPEYLAAVTPEPLEDKTTRPDDGFLSWKARQSELRRRNLREGLTELHQRKKDNDRRRTITSAANRRIREKLLYARERDDAWLTSPTVLSTQRPMKHHALPDPTRPARLAVKSQNVADMAAMREETRRNALHTLYVNAGDFITTGEQLDGVIDRAFDDNSQFRSDSSEGVNIWNLGYPETVQELLGKVNKSGRQTALDSAEGNEIVTRERMRKISEELTGGKMLEER
ncbi:hypothetical protein IMSHALPRED_008064 [Imshaugia aleurites]|uniref:Uncharacterized protein n=1 Tax=Imshaugia aleurites TaxID=172621 RepID=A0A8H3IJ78_9LECA|nr:hypothetical protein IMSHALPRED_008064 [Imshaugia aleurites]